VISDRAFGDRYIVVAVSVLIIAVLASVLMGRLEREMANAEYAKFELRLAEMRSALLLRQLLGKTSVAKASNPILAGGNPMEWLQGQGQENGQETNRPESYLGVAKLSTLSADDAQGNWVYDPAERVIAYLPQSSRWLERLGNQGPWLKFQLRAGSTGTEITRTKNGANHSFSLVPLQEKMW